MNDNVKHFSDADFQTQVLDSELPVLVDFWAPWCGPCRMVAPIVEEVAEEYAGRVVVGKMNTDENPAVPGQFRIMSIPTLLLFKDGQIVAKSIGARPKQALKEMIDGAI